MNKKAQTRIDSLNSAIEGIILATKTEKNMRLHFLSAVAVIMLSIFLKISKIDILLILLSVFFVLAAEIFNTSIEYLCDFVSPEHSAKIAAVKNLAAGAVLLSAFSSFAIGYIIFSKYIYGMIYWTLLMIRTAEPYIVIIVISVVFVGIIVIKALFNKGTPLRGGFPSGHSAVAFSIWLMVSLITMNPLVSLLTFVLAFIVALSRISSGIHTKLEALAGGVIGAAITAIIFKLFYLMYK